MSKQLQQHQQNECICRHTLGRQYCKCTGSRCLHIGSPESHWHGSILTIDQKELLRAVPIFTSSMANSASSGDNHILMALGWEGRNAAELVSHVGGWSAPCNLIHQPPTHTVVCDGYGSVKERNTTWHWPTRTPITTVLTHAQYRGTGTGQHPKWDAMSKHWPTRTPIKTVLTCA